MEARLIPQPVARTAAPAAALAARREGAVALLATLFKLRIALAIVLSAVGGALAAAGGWPAAGDILLLALAVLVAAGGAGACNHYFERDIDARMRRTSRRPFVTGRLRAAPGWPLLFAAMMLGGSGLAAWRFGGTSGALVLAGALTYSVVYTLWLKRRTPWNIVIGGAAGSFAVLAGAVAFGRWDAPAVLWLALVLLLWTPSHFWALAIAIVEDYRRAGVPMLPVTHGRTVAARWALLNTVGLVGASLAFALALGQVAVLAGAALGGGWMLLTGWRMARQPESAALAMSAFRASLLQLGLLLLPLFLALGAA